MAVTKIWSIRGTLLHPLQYITQDAKVKVDFYTKSEQQRLLHIVDFTGQEEAKEKLATVLGYTMQEGKTASKEERYVTGINCSETTALDEMQSVKIRYHKLNGVACYHGYQSFRPGEVTPEQAHEMGVELANRLWGDRHQVVVATHLDREHIHNHFVINSVSFVDGKKLRGSLGDYDRLRLMSDKLCKERGLSVVERPRRGRLPNPQIAAEMGISSPLPMHQRIHQDIDTAITGARNMEEFYNILTLMGYSFRKGNLKYFTIRAPGAGRSVRADKRFGCDYTLEAIQRRISSKGFSTPVSQQNSFPKYRYQGNFQKQCQVPKTHFRRLYLYYCYQIGVFPKKESYQVNKRELQKLRDVAGQTRLLVSNEIDNAEQLSSYQAKIEQNLKEFYNRRKQLYNSANYRKGGNVDLHQNEINILNTKIRQLRKQLRYCKLIAKHAETDIYAVQKRDDILSNSMDSIETKGAQNNDRARCSECDGERSDTLSR